MWLRRSRTLDYIVGVWLFVLLNRWDIAQRSVQRALTPCMNVQFILSQPKKEDNKMSLTREEFDKAVELNEEIREIEGIVFKPYKPHATS